MLLVDDEPAVRRAVARVLSRAGFTVLEAADGIDAVELFRAHQSDVSCVVCDVTMPRLDGWQTLTELRRLAPGFPVILASGYGEAQVMDGEHPDFPTAFLSKPYQADVLAHTLDRVISEREQRRSAGGARMTRIAPSARHSGAHRVACLASGASTVR